GEILGADGETINVMVEGQEEHFALSNISKANLIPKF
ncbi:TPA: ribosome maturation factor RimP, partial [Vibrio fluvialis clinical-1]|nr:ribosome maturation factor RimP [Vibrio fluvialis clinical-1]